MAGMKASSVVECVVAGLIVCVTFMCAMEILTRIAVSRVDDGVQVAMELAVRRTYREVADRLPAGEHYGREYEWGRVEVEIKDYHMDIKRLTITAVPAGTGRGIRYNYLVREQ